MENHGSPLRRSTGSVKAAAAAAAAECNKHNISKLEDEELRGRRSK